MLNSLTSQSLSIRQTILSQRLRELFKGVVSYGPLKGFNIDQHQTWGGSIDLASKLIGFYEREVLDAIFAKGKRYDYLVNLGAGDGYYGVGLVRQGVAARSICFESNADSRETIRNCAKSNGVEARVSVAGTASADFLDSSLLRDVSLADSLFIIDIEGNEFELLKEPTLDRLRRSELIIELHGPFFPKDPQLEYQLVALLEGYFDCKFLTTGPRDPSAISELSKLNDSDRWLVCSEGRPYLMRWIHCSPRA
jgi:hypothetical protein